jgi:hypothetical protein
MRHPRSRVECVLSASPGNADGDMPAACSTVKRWPRISLTSIVLLLLFVLSVTPTAWAQPLTQSQGPNFGTYPRGDIEIFLFASGGNGAGTYTWSVTSGSLPTGIALRSDLPVATTAGAALMGVATTPGTQRRSPCERDGPHGGLEGVARGNALPMTDTDATPRSRSTRPVLTHPCCGKKWTPKRPKFLL